MNDIAVSVPESVAPAPPVKPGFDRANRTDRFGNRTVNLVKAWFGTPSQRRLARGALQIDRIRYWESEFAKLSDQDVLLRGQQLRGRARGGETLDSLLPECFGLTCVASHRSIKLRPYDVQLVAGVVLHQGALAEVSTGEGKTLVATLPAVLNAMQGKGVHVTTVNDYLAQRDADYTAAVYNAMGLSVGVLQMKMSDEDRAAAYKAEITYGTASEFGFDFLRDRLKVKSSKATGAIPFWTAWLTHGHMELPQNPKVQREHHYAIVDEADNIFIDEARTPLIISTATRPATEEESVVYRWADGIAKQMARDQHFYLDEKKQKIELTDLGRHLIRYARPPHGPHSHAMDKLHEHIERALHAHFRFRLDQHYMVDDGKIVIIDESTGRPMPDRHWREGLHQAVEAKENQAITMASDHAAQITYQSYFRLYTKLSGMSGTAVQNYWELRRVYKLWVVCVPTNRPSIRENWNDRVFPNEDAKFQAVADEVKRLRELGRPVLIGTRSVEKSEKLSRYLDAASIPHRVLNARPGNQAQEADIVAQAGRIASVTIATNMAGRGTDILLGGNAETIAWSRLKDNYKHRHEVPADLWKRMVEEIETHENIHEQRQLVLDAGGLHVLGTERHEARRIDRQLQGRSARQGDPGSAQFFMSLDDELLEGLGEDRQASLKAIGERGGNGNWQGYHPGFLKAQRRLERRHYRQRVDLMIYERQRQEILKDIGADPYVD